MSAQALLSVLTAPAPGGGVSASVDQGEAATAFSALMATETAVPAEAAPSKRLRAAAPAPTPELVEAAQDTPAATAPTVVQFTIVAPVAVAVGPTAATSASAVAFASDPAPSQTTTKDAAASSPTDAAPTAADPSTDVAAQGIAVSSSNAALAQTAVTSEAAADDARQAEASAKPTASTTLATAAAPTLPRATSIEVASSLTAPPQADVAPRADTDIPAATAAATQGVPVATSTPPSVLPTAPDAIAEPSTRAPASNPVATVSAPGNTDAVTDQTRRVSVSSTPIGNETGVRPPAPLTPANDGAALARVAVARVPPSDTPVGARPTPGDAPPPAQPSTAKAAVTAWISPAPRDATPNPDARRAIKAAPAWVAFDVAAEPQTPSSTEAKADAPVRSTTATATLAPTALAASAQLSPDLPTPPVTPSPRDIIEQAADAGSRSTPPSAQGTTATPMSAAAPSPSPTAQTQPVLADATAQSAVPAVETAATLPVEPLSAEPTEAILPGSATTAPAEARTAAAPQVGLGSLSRATIETTAQLAAQITRRLEGRSTRFEMALTPDGLGRVDVSLDIDADGQLAARLAFDNPLAATDLRGRADELRRQLEDAGFTLARDALEFSQRDGSSGGQNAFDRHHNRATAYASRAAAEAVEAPIAAWINPSPTPRGVDLKV